MLPLGHVRSWIFDLDNTLYPASSDLFPQIDRRIQIFIEKALGLGPDAARALQKRYFRDYGLTVRGLMLKHGIAPDEFLSFVHDIDHSVLAPAPRLARALSALPGRRVVFTNATRRHAEKVLDRLGLSHCFDDIFDIVAARYRPKPDAASYAALLARHRIEPGSAAMFEDIPGNLAPAARIGMVTVLVRDPDFKGFRHAFAVNPDTSFIDHITDDLAGWLNGVAGLS